MNQAIRDSIFRGDLDKMVMACRKDSTWWTEEDAAGKSYLHLAIEQNRPDMALWLIARGALVNQPDKDGYTPLMFAALKGSYAVATLLIANGANPDIKESSGQTALHKAIFSRNEPIIELLLEAGAETNVEDNEGNRPLDLLFEVPSIARMLREKRALLGRGPGLQIITAA